MPTSRNSIATIGEQIRALREKAVLSLREVASNIGIDTSLLGKIERNERQPTKEQIKQIATFFKIDEKQRINYVNLHNTIRYEKSFILWYCCWRCSDRL